MEIPRPLKLEHEELHAELASATKAGGQVGEAAKTVAKVLHEHFMKEEEFALPPLGLLASLARDEVAEDAKSVFSMTDRLKAELPKMLEEHKAVVIALENLKRAAKTENKPEHARFAEKLILHAQTEEEVLYPLPRRNIDRRISKIEAQFGPGINRFACLTSCCARTHTEKVSASTKFQLRSGAGWQSVAAASRAIREATPRLIYKQRVAGKLCLRGC